MTSKTQCDFCGRLIPWGEDFFWLNAVFTADSHPEHPGHKLGWDICQECFVTKLPKYSPLDSREWVELPPEGRAALQDAMEFLVYAEIRNEGVNPGNHKKATNALDTIRGMLD